MSPDPGARSITLADVRALIDRLDAYLARPEVVERLNTMAAGKSRASVVSLASARA